MSTAPASSSNEAVHTPGPWVVNGFGGGFRVIARMQPHEVAVSATAQGGDEISNARLIAAAPELLEALQALIPMMEEWHDEFPEYVGDNERPALIRARTAIARATGAA
jgi:hypothetical protein